MITNRTPGFPLELRELIATALPEDTSLHGGIPELRYTYLPAAHAKALRPDSMLVVGIRGSGKSFWWAALQEQEHRAAVGNQIGIDDLMITSTGFGEKSSPDDYPGRNTISELASRYDPRGIWQTIILKHAGGMCLPSACACRRSSNPSILGRIASNGRNEIPNPWRDACSMRTMN